MHDILVSLKLKDEIIKHHIESFAKFISKDFLPVVNLRNIENRGRANTRPIEEFEKQTKTITNSILVKVYEEMHALMTKEYSIENLNPVISKHNLTMISYQIPNSDQYYLRLEIQRINSLFSFQFQIT